jgi:hypothetical protein
MKIGLKTPRGVGYDDLWGMHHHHRMDLKEPCNTRNGSIGRDVQNVSLNDHDSDDKRFWMTLQCLSS